MLLYPSRPCQGPTLELYILVVCIVTRVRESRGSEVASQLERDSMQM